MNSKYSISRFATGTLAAVAALLSTTACHDDFGYQNEAGQRIAFKLTAAEAWRNGMSVNENAPTTRCTSVQELSGDGDTQLYLHTVVADNPVAEPALTSRGTPIKTTDAFKDKYDSFSLSGILVTSGNSVDDVAPSFAHNLSYNSTSGLRTDGEQLLWPWTGSVHYFAFAPTIASFGENSPLKISEDSHLGAPILTYTVPTDVTKQVDLMTATKIATLPSENLEFKHALTAVQIKCAEDMLAGTITEVTISGIYGTGSLKIGSENETIGLDWKTSTPTTYTISKKIDLPASTDENVADKIHVAGETQIIGKEGDNLTFLLLPQVLPKDATMTIKFTDKATKTPRTLTGSIAGQTWEAGKIVTYSISPSSIHISAKVELNKKGVTAEDPTGDIMPYSGVWYDAKYTAKAEIVQAKQVDGESEVRTETDIEIPADKVKFKYKLDGSENWVDCTTDANGLLTIAPQPAYASINGDDKFDKTSENGTVSNPFSLSDEKGETANCYLVDKAGYYSLELAYGNKCVMPQEITENGFMYYPKHDEMAMPGDGLISGAADAVLCWQDAPDLIDPTSVGLDEEEKNLVFRIRKNTLAQGNALLAVRNSSKEILWSWHIWVTPYKKDFYTSRYAVTTYKNMATKSDKVRDYEFAMYNLGWCDKHNRNIERKFRLRAVINMSVYGGEKETKVDIPGEFTQMEYRGSDAGDNTYYQWGRKDPMLGGIYNVGVTTCYTYTQKQSTNNTTEFTMENKQVFNQYKNEEEGCDYTFRKNPGDMVEPDDEQSKGATIGYTIQHPYIFITNSRTAPSDGNKSYPHYTPKFCFRNHWHRPHKHYPVSYLKGEGLFYDAWDAGAKEYGAVDNPVNNANYKTTNAADVVKTVYDPCPPLFKVPPIDAFRAIVTALGSRTNVGNGWKTTIDGKDFTVPITGMRDYSLRPSEWKTIQGLSDTELDTFYRTTVPAFRTSTFVSSATLAKKDDTSDGYENGYQLMILQITNSTTGSSATASALKSGGPSSNSYGLPVRPIYSVNK